MDDTVVFTAMNAAVGRGKQGIRDYFNRMMVGPDKVVESVKMDFIPDALSVFYGPDVAVSTGSAPAHYVLTNGMDFEIDRRSAPQAPSAGYPRGRSWLAGLLGSRQEMMRWLCGRTWLCLAALFAAAPALACINTFRSPILEARESGNQQRMAEIGP